MIIKMQKLGIIAGSFGALLIMVFIISQIDLKRGDLAGNIVSQFEKSSSSIEKTKKVIVLETSSRAITSRSNKEESISNFSSEKNRLGEFVALSNAIIRVVGFNYPDYSLDSVKNANGELIGYAVILDDSRLNFQGDKNDSLKIIAEDESSYRAEIQCSMWEKNKSGSWKSRPLADCFEKINGLIGKIESEARIRIKIENQFNQ